MPPKRKAPPKLSGLVGSDDEDIMQVTAKGKDTLDEPPAKRRRGRPRTSHENVTETKPTKPATRAKKQQAAVTEPEAPAEKKSTRRGRPRGSSRAAQGAETLVQKVPSEDTVSEHDDTHSQGNEDNVTATETTKQPPKAAKTKAAAPPAARGRGRGRPVSTQLHTDGEFEFTPGGARQETFQESRQEQTASSPTTRSATRTTREIEVEESQQDEEPAADLVNETPTYNRNTTSPSKNSRSRLSILRNSSSPRKHRLGGIDSEQSGDPELRRRLGDTTKKLDALESKYRNMREIGIVEANANMEKLRKQHETVITGTLFGGHVTERAHELIHSV